MVNETNDQYYMDRKKQRILEEIEEQRYRMIAMIEKRQNRNDTEKKKTKLLAT